MAKNKLNYTSITHDDMLNQIHEIISSDTRFDRFRESGMSQTLIEIFAGTTDIVNYYLNRRAEECYYDTAQLRSSVISLSRMFGYVMNRKEPARAKLRMIVKGDIDDNVVQLPYYSKFSYNGDNFVLINTMSYRFTAKELNDMKSIPNHETNVVLDAYGVPIEIAQGEIKEKIINGSTNGQIGAPFQIYKIEDETFSNSYGDRDFFYEDVTRVYVGNNKVDSEDDSTSTRFSIDRRSLLNWETIDTSDVSKSHKVCVIRTTPDGYVELLFGDGHDISDSEQNQRVYGAGGQPIRRYNPTTGVTETVQNKQGNGGFARKGAITREDNIYVQYLSTKGASSNKAGTRGDKINFSGKIYNSNGIDITDKITFELDSNVYGGGDDESSESIKYSSPKIYHSLDRLVSEDDYLAYLKSLNAPVNVQNAVAWGEQLERDKAHKFADMKMFNAILFSVCGSLYNTDTSPSFALTGSGYETSVLDVNYDPYDFQTQGYFNVYVIQEMVNQLKRYKTLTSFNECDSSNLGGVYRSDGGATSSDIIATKIQAALQDAFALSGGSAKLTFGYTSDSKENVSNIVAHGTDAEGKTITIDGITDVQGSGKDYLVNLAKKINDALANVKDYRGNATDNANYKKDAFVGRWENNEILVWDELQADNDPSNAIFNFRLRFNEQTDKMTMAPKSPCYITQFGADTLATILGLNNKQSFPVSESSGNMQMSGKINILTENLMKRSQVNVKNVYLSPMIQRFNIEGDIFVKPLFDSEQVRTDTCNSLYGWLDINADFNRPLYISNIIEKIESHPGVVHANVKLVPEDKDMTESLDNTENKWYNPDPEDNKIYRKYQIDYSSFKKINKGSFSAFDFQEKRIGVPTFVDSGDYWKISSPGYVESMYYNKHDYMLYTGSKFINVGPNWKRNPIAQAINTALYSYISGDDVIGQYKESWKRNIFTYDESLPNDDQYREFSIESKDYGLSTMITERTFFNGFAGKVYNTFLGLSNTPGISTTNNDGYIIHTDDRVDTPNYAKFLGKDLELSKDVVHSSVVKSDFAVIMEQIHQDLSYVIKLNMLDSAGNVDEEYNDDNEYVRGGYTIGSEIVQIILDKSTNIKLKFKYK